MLLGVVGDKIKQGTLKIYTALKNGLMAMYYKVYGVLLIQVTRLVQLITNLFVQLKLNIEHYLAQFIIQVRLMKVELMIVLLNLGVRGQQLLTTAHKTLQRVLALLKRGK